MYTILDFSSFSVDDITKARDFYQNVLGLQVKEPEDPAGNIFGLMYEPKAMI